MHRLASAVVALALAACQLAGTPSDAPSPSAAGTGGRGAPGQRVPQSLDELLARVEPAALEWQEEPRLAEVSVRLGDGGSWDEARVVYLAAAADRLLAVRISGDGLSQQRTTLSTLGLPPVSGDGLDDLPPLPDGTVEPRELVAAAEPALTACGAGPVVTVLYATGAPVSWDGAAWSVPPEWTATLLDAEGAGATLDPAGGGPVADPCVAPPAR